MRWNHVGPSFSRENKEILFLFGPARGGTTFLNNLLFRHFGYGMGPEGTFVVKYARRLNSYGSLEHESNLSRLIQDVAASEMLYIARHKYRRHPFDVSPKLIRDHLQERSYAGVVYAVFECVAELQNRSKVGNKNPAYWGHFDLLDRLFPSQAKYLCIVRDGRDVALSNMKTRWGSSSAYACATGWVSMLEALERMRKELSPGRLLVVRYEDLLQNPETSLSKVRDFLVPELPHENLEAAIAEIVQGGRRTNFDKWRTQMRPHDVRIYEGVGGKWLSDYGYSRSVVDPRVSLWERIWYRLKEYARLVRVNLRAILRSTTS